MNIDKVEALKIAEISKVAVGSHELDAIVKQMQEVLSYAERVAQVATEIEDQPSNKNINFVRPDVVCSSDPEALLVRAPEREEHFFVVPKILDSK